MRSFALSFSTLRNLTAEDPPPLPSLMKLPVQVSHGLPFLQEESASAVLRRDPGLSSAKSVKMSLNIPLKISCPEPFQEYIPTAPLHFISSTRHDLTALVTVYIFILHINLHIVRVLSEMPVYFYVSV